MKDLRQTYFVRVPLSKVWKALVHPKYIDGWGGGPSKMDDKEGSSFSLWGGSIVGKNTKVVPHQQLVQDWQEKEWENPSKVTFNLKEKDGGTEIELIHEDIPDKSHKDISEGWKEYYLGPLKKYLESK